VRKALFAILSVPLLLGTVLGLPASAHIRKQTNVQPSWAPAGSLKLAFDDEFTGTTLGPRWDKTWWVNPGNGNGYSWGGNPSFRACYFTGNDSESNGAAHLVLNNTPSTCGPNNFSFTGAVLETDNSFSQDGGSFEARVRIPCSGGQPIGWPAWYINNFFFSAEADLVEGGTIVNGTSATLHYGNPEQSPSYTSPTPKCGWHLFGAAWDAVAQKITVYWDSQPVLTHAFVPGDTHPDFLIFDYQMCPHCQAPPNGPASLDVGWVRAWAPPGRVSNWNSRW